MPSVLGNSPFLSLRSDDSCGRNHTSNSRDVPFRSLTSNGQSSHSNTNGHSSHNHTNAKSNGHSDSHAETNGNSHAHNDEFLKLSTPQQDVLMLHGPRQRYSLEKAQEIPELKHDREMLIQVLAIGLNPVDWKGADYGNAVHHCRCTIR